MDDELDDHTKIDGPEQSVSGPVRAPGPMLYVAGEPVEGSVVNRFVLLKKLGEGGMGVVLAAHDPKLDRTVALKLLKLRPGDQRADRARLIREAQMLAKLDHPNVVRVFDVGEHFEQVYVAMEYIKGQTLREWMRGRERPPPWQEVLAVFMQAGAGLVAAHAMGVVHRDFKPANVMFGRGRARVMDFGLARVEVAGHIDITDTLDQKAVREAVAAAQAGENPQTQAGTLMGTPGYMSPEQAARLPADAASDQFSFCVSLYEALYGERPFIEGTAWELRSPPDDANVPTWLRAVVVRGLAIDPEQRWNSMSALLAALRRDVVTKRWQVARGLLMGTLFVFAAIGLWAVLVRQVRAAEGARQEQRAAEAEREKSLEDALREKQRVRDALRVLAAGDSMQAGELRAALLSGVSDTATPGWRSEAIEVLQRLVSKQVLRGHEGQVVGLDVSPDDAWLATASHDGTARLWRRTDGASIVLSHADQVSFVAFDPRGAYLATASKDGTAAIWRVPRHGDASLEPPVPQVLRGHTDELWSARFSPDGSKLVTASGDGTARVWSLDASREEITYQVTDDQVWTADFSPDGKWIVAGDGEGGVSVWSVEQPERRPILLEGHTDMVGHARFLPDMRTIVTASRDGTARLFRVDLDAIAPLLAHAVLRHNEKINDISLSSDGRRIVTASHGLTAKLWSLDADGRPSGSEQVFANGSSGAYAAALSPDQRTLAVGHGDGTVDVRSLDSEWMFSLVGHDAAVFRLQFSRDGRWLYSCSNDGTVRVWDMAQERHAPLARQLSTVAGDTGNTWMVWRDDRVDVGPMTAPVAVHERTVVSAAAGLIAVADPGSELVRVWRLNEVGGVDSHEPLATLTSGRGGVARLLLDPRGELLAASQPDGAVLSWQLGADPADASPKPVQLARHQSESKAVFQMDDLQFSPDGERLVSSGRSGIIYVWARASLMSEQPVPRSVANGERVYRLFFDLGGQRLATIGADDVVRVWNLADLDADPLLLRHPNKAYGSSFHPGGRDFVVGCEDGGVYLWDLDAPATPTILAGATSAISDVGFSDDGSLIAAVSTDGGLHVWRHASATDGVVHLDTGSGGLVATRELQFLEGQQLITGVLHYRNKSRTPDVKLFNLAFMLQDDTELFGRLKDATNVCLTADQLVRLAGENTTEAEESSKACNENLRGW